MSVFTITPDFSDVPIDEVEALSEELLPIFVERTTDFALAMVSQQVMSIETFNLIQQGISVRREGKTIIIETTDEADSFEKGWGPFDLGQEILNSSPETSVSEDGSRYTSVPIYPEGSTPIKRRLPSSFGSSLPGKNSPYGGSRLTPDLMKESKALAKKKGNLSFKNDRKPKFNTGGNTFRTVSDKSSGWKHPGVEGLHFAEMTANYMEEQIQETITSIFEGDS